MEYVLPKTSICFKFHLPPHTFIALVALGRGVVRSHERLYSKRRPRSGRAAFAAGFWQQTCSITNSVRFYREIVAEVQ